MNFISVAGVLCEHVLVIQVLSSLPSPGDTDYQRENEQCKKLCFIRFKIDNSQYWKQNLIH